jgi:drug/metabolite transporter (DMT)-like permease
VKRYPPGDPVIATALAMPIGASLLVVMSLLSGEHWTIPSRSETWLALGYLVVLATIVNFSLTLFVLSRWSATVASYGFLLSPLVTIILGALLLDETVQPAFLLGGGLVLAGVYVGAFMHRAWPARRLAPSLTEAPNPRPNAAEVAVKDD